MNFDVIESVLTLFAAIIGLLLTLFRYIEQPKRGWLYISVFFMMHLLSDYYWTTYTLVMGENPDVSAFMAYFGWNVGYIFLLITVLRMRPEGAKRYFNPLMLLPIPLNILQFTIYIQYGGLLNNIWEETITTITACICLQVILYYLFHRKEGGHFPRIHTVILIFIGAEYGMWTSSCFDWPGWPISPYYLFSLVQCISLVFFGWAAGRDYESEGRIGRERSAQEMRFNMIMQIVVTTIILFGCIGGYHIANRMKRMIPQGTENEGAYRGIAIILFVISIVLVVMIMTLIIVTASRYKKMEKSAPVVADRKRGRFNFIFTLVITFVLMLSSIIYTSRLFNRVSVTGVLVDGKDKATLVATDLETYLGVARSILWVTADTVDLMLQGGASQELVKEYIISQTANQAEQFDENFTGLYAYINGEYIDGSGWEPPEGYDAETRDWYKAAVEANGKTIIVSPYLDADTGSLVITICKLLDDGGKPGSYDQREVVALDMVVNHVQKITEDVSIDGKGYAMVVNYDGMVIAHPDTSFNGQNIKDMFGKTLMEQVIRTGGKGSLDVTLDGENSTLFVDKVFEQWYVLIAVSDAELFAEVNNQLTVNILVSVVIFLLISFFYYLGYKNEQLSSRKMEELQTVSLKQEYEARMLKLEKSAADEANKAKSRFLADMSHEIRTPINAILGMNEMVIREAEDEDILDYSRNIRVSGKNLLQIINSILDFSKIEDGKMEIVPDVYSLGKMISYLMNSIRERAKEKDLELIFDIDENLPSVLYGDDSRINQIIMNLLTNAVKYTPEGSVTLSIKERKRENGNILLYVEVKDTGIGIKESDMSKLFESFERLDLKKNRNIEGTGLGMSITTSLLGLMGSELKVQSKYGEGSVFWFELWQRIENEELLGDYTKISADEDEDLKKETLYAPSAHILVVDDTRLNLLVVTKLLKRTGIIIDTASSGTEALELTAKKKYDVILLDQRMPGMDGTQTLEAIRSQESGKNKETPVICLTADAIRGARERLLAEGFTDYLSKPVDGRTLENTLIKYLPQEKIEQRKEEISTDEASMEEEKDSLFESLENNGVNTETGMEFCMDDDEMYRQILAVYVKESSERNRQIRSYYASKDWTNYEIQVHALKSTSRTIGAEALSEISYGLEMASLDGDIAVIERDHEKALEMYEELVSVIDANLDVERYAEDEDDITEYEANQ